MNWTNRVNWTLILNPYTEDGLKYKYWSYLYHLYCTQHNPRHSIPLPDPFNSLDNGPPSKTLDHTSLTGVTEIFPKAQMKAYQSGIQNLPMIPILLGIKSKFLLRPTGSCATSLLPVSSTSPHPSISATCAYMKTSTFITFTTLAPYLGTEHQTKQELQE